MTMPATCVKSLYFALDDYGKARLKFRASEDTSNLESEMETGERTERKKRLVL